jgi:hypothetical protein
MATADIKPIDEWSSPRILTTKTIIIGNVLTLAPVVLMFAGMGLAAVVAHLAFAEGVPDGEPPLLGPAAGILGIAVGVLIAAAAAYWGLRNTTQLGSWYLRRVARGEIKSRPNGIVDPDDPKAIFVELVPRPNWTRLMLETATDVGFLLVEEARREVLFEGDGERMRIPAGAILSCEVEQTIIGGEAAAAAMKYYFTVIRVQSPSSIRELPFAYRGDLGPLGAEVRERRAVALRDRIRSLPNASCQFKRAERRWP